MQKLDIDTVASNDYMIHDVYYYSIVGRDNIPSLLDDIDQKIIWICKLIFFDTTLCSQDIWDRILMLQCIWMYYQVWRIAHVRLSKAQQKHSAAALPMNSIKLNIGDVAR